MTDEVNQLPSSLPEKSPPRDEPFDHEGKPEIHTLTPLEKEFNIMTQDDLDRLRESCSFSSGIQARLLMDDKTIWSIRPVWRYYKRTLSINEFRCLFSLFKNPKPGSRWLYFKTTGSSPLVYLEKKEFCGSRDHRAPQCFTLGRARMSSSGGDNAEDMSVEGTAVVVGDEARALGRRPGQIHDCLPSFDRMVLSSSFPKISLKKLAQLEEKSKVATPSTKGMVIQEKRSWNEVSDTSPNWKSPIGGKVQVQLEEKSKVATPSTKGMVIREKQSWDEVSDISPKGEGDHAVGTLANPDTVLGPRISMLGSPSIAVKLLGGVIPPSDKGKALDDLKKAKEDRDAIMGWIEKQVALAKKIVIEEFKSSDDFQEALEFTASKYFGEGFDFCKRQISRLHPDLDILEMKIDAL
ncbi:hypothetical protein Acr_08g0000630 [Actinidia rufa]|uniref:Uncharacterized protein n=1 Tax=Actinidia rufa TaxID=165716 RepID=A0A7J0F1B0_9ERIC|nr:hypothetical protein Acr_08g0000630 [Actinidia rufa]